MKIVIDENLCIGCGVCESICSNVFAVNDSTMKAYVIENADLNSKCLDEAIESCPVNAIKKVD